MTGTPDDVMERAFRLAAFFRVLSPLATGHSCSTTNRSMGVVISASSMR